MKRRVCCLILVLSILCLPAQQVLAAPAGPAAHAEEKKEEKKKPHEKEHEKPVPPHEKKHEKPVPPHEKLKPHEEKKGPLAEKPKPPVTGEKPVPPHEKEKEENKQPQEIPAVTPTVTPTVVPEENTEISSSGAADKTSSTGTEVVRYALQFVGNPYKYGGTSLTNGADCSGFVQSVYSHFNYNISRTSKEQAVNAGYTDVALKESELLPGDLIFYASSNGAVYHVALYIGDGKVVHAANVHAGIIVSEYTYMRPYKARRIIEA